MPCGRLCWGEGVLRFVSCMSGGGVGLVESAERDVAFSVEVVVETFGLGVMGVGGWLPRFCGLATDFCSVANASFKSFFRPVSSVMRSSGLGGGGRHEVRAVREHSLKKSMEKPDDCSLLVRVFLFECFGCFGKISHVRLDAREVVQVLL